MTTPADIAKLKDKAFAAFGSGKLELALKLYREALAEAPKDAMVRQRVGDILRTLGRTQEAIDTYASLAVFFANDGLLLKGVAICKLILSLDPTHERTQAILADLYAERGDIVIGATKPPPLPTAVPAGAAKVDAVKLAPLELFSELPRNAFIDIVNSLQTREVAAGAHIIREGDPAVAMYIVVEGEVIVRREGQEQIVALLKAGAFFGEMALVTAAPRMASVIAHTDCVLLKLPHTTLETLQEQHPGVDEVLLRFYKCRMLANLLRCNPLFELLTDAERQSLKDAFVTTSGKPGMVLLREGQRADGFYVILRGACAAYSITPDGKRLDYPELKEGDVFGEIALILDAQCTATVEVTQMCTVLRLNPEIFHRALLANPKSRQMLVDQASVRLKRTAAMSAPAGPPAGPPLPTYLV